MRRGEEGGEVRGGEEGRGDEERGEGEGIQYVHTTLRAVCPVVAMQPSYMVSFIFLLLQVKRALLLRSMCLCLYIHMY